MALQAAAVAIDSGSVLILITLVVVPIAAISFARAGGAWRKIGKGAFAIEQELPPKPAAGGAEPAGRRQVEAEARQMLEAKAYRRLRSGGPPVDVEAEVRALLEQTSPASVDEELRDEVRRLVVARNERRLRQGEAQLDVEAETDRQLADFIGSG